MKGPFDLKQMPIINNGSLADYYENGGKEEDIYKHLCGDGSAFRQMKIKDHARLLFEWPKREPGVQTYDISVWVLRVDDRGIADDFRFCYSSQEVQHHKILRGWNP